MVRDGPVNLDHVVVKTFSAPAVDSRLEAAVVQHVFLRRWLTLALHLLADRIDIQLVFRRLGHVDVG